jgi:hypothetical protein
VTCVIFTVEDGLTEPVRRHYLLGPFENKVTVEMTVLAGSDFAT